MLWRTGRTADAKSIGLLGRQQILFDIVGMQEMLAGYPEWSSPRQALQENQSPC